MTKGAESMSMTSALPQIEEIFQRSLTAHLPIEAFSKLQHTSVLIAGMGGGSNIAELLARKGVGHFLIADLDRYEPHNIRQRGSQASTWGKEKVKVMTERLLDINPHATVHSFPDGITLHNVEELARRADWIVDMIDFHALREKVALYRAARKHGRTVLTAPSIVNGAILYIFRPEGITFEEFFGYVDDVPIHELGTRLLKRLIPRYSKEAPEELYLAAARGERTIPLDAVGVDQAAVLAVTAIENLVLGRVERVVTIPRGIQVDLSDPSYLARIVDFSKDFEDRP
jgi:molybdopterin/thiamine biosynthesis adenylyltransferase